MLRVIMIALRNDNLSRGLLYVQIYDEDVIFYRYESHYNSVHKNVCSICRRFYPTNHLLDIHLLEWHDSMFELLAEKQPMVGSSSIL